MTEARMKEIRDVMADAEREQSSSIGMSVARDLLAHCDELTKRIETLEEAHAESVRLFNWFRNGMHPLESAQKWLAKYDTLARAAANTGRD